jgi:hypothetical protein
MRMSVEQLVEWRLAGETEVLGENLPQRHFVHQMMMLEAEYLNFNLFNFIYFATLLQVNCRRLRSVKWCHWYANWRGGKDMVVAEYKIVFRQLIGMTKEIRETCQDSRHPAGFRIEYLHNTNQARFVLFHSSCI